MSHHFVISSQKPPTESGMSSMGSRKDIIAELGRMNTYPEQPGEDVLWGPGIRMEMRPGEDPLKQMLLSIVEEEIAWLVIARITRAFNWRIVDVETGDEIVFENGDATA